MKPVIYILTLLFSLPLFGQNKDKRAELDIRGNVKEISVAPNEKIWLVTYSGQTFFTENIDSLWHYGNEAFKAKNKSVNQNSPLDRITFFNNDTAIMTGYISYSPNINKKNGLYLTKDGGFNWEIIDFGGDGWIYTAFADKKGNAWIAGSKKELYYSMDFGEHWEIVNLPYKTSDRTYSIYMIDSMKGVVAGESNELLYTTDNCKTFTNIPTPLDQGKYEIIKSGYSRGEAISKVILWKNLFILKQNKHTFYSDTNNIDWKRFPIAVKFFEKDMESEILYAITYNGQLIQFSSPTDFKFLTGHQIKDVTNIKVVNKSLYLLTKENEVYKVNESEFILKIPFTTDYKIKEPSIIKKSENYFWGATGKNLYLAENYSFNWHRVKRLDFFVSDITVVDDSLIILWDGHKDNYQYSHIDNKINLFFVENPLNDFLKYPLKSISISAGSQGSFNSKVTTIEYVIKDDSTFIAPHISILNSSEQEIVNFYNDVSIKSLEKILTTISLYPYEIPTIEDFFISETDKENFLSLVEEEIKKNEPDYLNRKKNIDRDFYYSILSKLDTISNSIIDNVINHREVGWSTSRTWFTIIIINKNNDTLKIKRKYSIRVLPWNLPWVFEYNGLKFNCYNIAFSRYINSCIYEKFDYKKAFDNKYLIMSIANYLWNKEE